MQFLKGSISGRGLLRALKAWFITALACLLLAAGIMSALNTGERILAYTSSAISMLSAFAAGAASVKGSSGGRLIASFVCGLFISLMLLLLGFIVNNGRLSPDGVLSVIMFTLSGAMLGGVFAPTRTKKASKNRKHGVKKRVNVIL